MSGRRDGGAPPRWLAAAALALPALAILRLAVVRFYQMDEFVFTRCAWLVAGGNVPYRDFFDHHTPLYYLLLSPVLALAPEGPAALTWARLAHLALFAAVIAVAARLAWRLGGAWGAWLATLLLLAFNGYVARAIETRPEMLATLGFVGCAALLLTESPPDRRRALAAGALAAMAVLSTQKALYYLWGLGLLWLVDLAARRWRPREPSLGRPWAFAAGAVLPALALVAALAATGSLPAFWRQNVELALSWQATELTFPASRYLAPLLAETPHWFLLVTAGAAALLVHPAARAATTPRQRRVYFALAVPAGVSLLVNPIPWPYNFLPVFTILAPLTALVPVVAAARLGAAGGRRLTALVGLLALVPFALQWRAELHRDNHSQRRELARVLALTEPGEPVFDTNGGYLFRPAATWYWYHSAAMRDLMRDELARTTIAEVRAAAPAAWIADPRFADLPENVRDFFRSRYLRHSGALLFWGSAYRSPAGGVERFEFEAIRDGRYFLEPAEAASWRDVRVAFGERVVQAGRPFHLSRGVHDLTVERPPGDAALDFFVLWLPADGRPWRPLSGRPPPFYPHFF